MAFHFASTLDPSRGERGAASYARNMCTLWLFLFLSLIVDIFLVLNGHSFADLLGRERLVSSGIAIAVVIPCAALVRFWLRNDLELRDAALVLQRYKKLSWFHKGSIMTFVLVIPIAFILI